VVNSLLGVQIANIIPLALLFFLLALVEMALAHSQDSTEWSMRSHRGLWILLLLISIGLILALGLIIPSVVTADLMQLIVVPLKWMWSMIEKGVGFLLSLIPMPELTEEMLPSEPMPEMPPEEFAEAIRMPEWVMGAGRIGWNVLVLGLILVALWQLSSQFFGWLRRRLMTTAGAEIESLEGAFRTDLLSFLKGIVLALLRFRLPFWRRRRSKSLPPEITSVSQIYHKLLQWVGGGGWPRPAFQTPYEYLYTLEELLPMSKDALRFITERYVSARYGSSLPTEEELHQLKQSWHQVRRNRLKVLTGEYTRKKEITNG